VGGLIRWIIGSSSFADFTETNPLGVTLSR